LDLLKTSLIEAPIIKKNEYDYIIHPIIDGIPEINPVLLEEVVDEILKRLKNIGEFDKILTIESMGIPLAANLSNKTNVPFTIIRKRKYGFSDELIAYQKTGYSKNKLYINGLKKGEKIIIVDDLISTGGTLRGILRELSKIDVEIKGIYIVVNKGEEVEKINKEFNLKIDVLTNIKIIKNKIKIL